MQTVRQRRGVRLVAIYKRARCLGLLPSDSSSTSSDQVAHLIDEFYMRLDDDAQRRRDDTTTENVPQQLTELQENTQHEIITSPQDGEPLPREEENEYFNLILQLASEKQLTWELRKKNKELEEMVQQKAHVTATKRPSLPFDVESWTSSRIDGNSIERLERRLHLCNGHVKVLLEENRRLLELLRSK